MLKVQYNLSTLKLIIYNAIPFRNVPGGIKGTTDCIILLFVPVNIQNNIACVGSCWLKFTDAFKQISFVHSMKLRSVNAVFTFVCVCTFGFQNKATNESMPHFYCDIFLWRLTLSGVMETTCTWTRNHRKTLIHLFLNRYIYKI